MTTAHWIYDNDNCNQLRYTLGVAGQRMIAVIGANPSTAVPGMPDSTVKRIMNFADFQGFDGWVVVNLSPQITPDPNKLSSELKGDAHRRNLKIINETFRKYPIIAIWAAWGNIIEKRGYLIKSLGDILALTVCQQRSWVQLDPPTIKGHPRHPLYHPANSRLIPFEGEEYLDRLKTDWAGGNKSYL